MSAAVMGLIAYAAVVMAAQALEPPTSWICGGILLGALGILIIVPRINSTWIIFLAAVAGWLLLSHSPV